MDRARINEGVRRMRFEELLDRHERGDFGQEAAAELLGVSERTFRRWRDRLRDEGPPGLADRRLSPSGRRAAQAEIERMLGLYRAHYGDFTVKHFHEQLVKRHDYKLGYTVTKAWLHRSGLVRPATKRSAHRKKRPRRPMVGMMLHQDASTHAWLAGGLKHDLVVTMDDATSALYSMFLVDEEGTASSLRGLAEVAARHGLFCSLYTDRGSHYFHTPEAGGKVSRTALTQVGRALSQLGVEHIAAYSPQARGRSERAFGTLQDRLPKELALAGIATVEAANRWIADVYIAEHNAAFAVEAEQEGAGFEADGAGAVARDPLRSRRARGGQRQHRQVAWATPPAAAEPAQAPLRQGHRAGPRVSRQLPGHLLGTSPARRLRSRRSHHPSHRTRRMTRFHRSDFFRGMPRNLKGTKRTDHELQKPDIFTS
jgi:transposase